MRDEDLEAGSTLRRRIHRLVSEDIVAPDVMTSFASARKSVGSWLFCAASNRLWRQIRVVEIEGYDAMKPEPTIWFPFVLFR